MGSNVPKSDENGRGTATVPSSGKGRQPANPDPSGVAVVMPVHGRLEEAAEALLGLSRLVPAPAQVVVVVDMAQDAGAVARLPSGAIVVEVPHASGPAHARNVGAAATSAEILLFVDSDVVAMPDTVARVTEAFARWPGASAVFGSYDLEPGDPGFLSQYRNLMHHFVHQRSREEAGTFWAGLGAVRAVGGFDVGYRFPSIEDIELGCRMRDDGREIRLVKTLQGRHLKRWTAWGMLRTDLLRRGIPWMRLILSRGHVPSDLNLDWASRWSTLMAWCAVLSLPLGAHAAAWGWAALASGAGFVVLNLPFYRFLARHRGAWFALRSVPWHALHFFQCGLAGMLGLLAHGRDQLRTSRPTPA